MLDFLSQYVESFFHAREKVFLFEFILCCVHLAVHYQKSSKETIYQYGSSFEATLREVVVLLLPAILPNRSTMKQDCSSIYWSW